MNFFGGRSDLPLKDDATSRFLPWLIAPMVFLSAVALAAAFTLTSLVGSWDHDVSGTLTVEIAAPSTPANVAAAQTKAAVDQALAILKATPGVRDARALSNDKLATLLEPWLGNPDLLKDLPLPAMIDVTVDPSARPDLTALTDKLTQAVPGATIDDHRVWLSRLIELGKTIAWTAIGIVALVGLVTAATVIYATRTGMAVHREVIEVLHMIGATDDYIARQFAARAFTLAIKGGIAGLILTLPVIAAVIVETRRIEGGFLSDLHFPPIGWVACALLPAVAALLSMATARITVHGTLVRLV
ncbi:MAG TPA: FtsX-like permease family protein [Magnetospirillaceae bacterium]|jgi:cell division transport system permease protein